MNMEVGKAVHESLEEIDRMSPELRECVHEFGYAIVKAFVGAGIRKPALIRHLVVECWRGARQPMQRARYSTTGAGGKADSGLLVQLDWILLQNGAEISAATLLRVLWQSSIVIIHTEPTRVMLEASLAEVNNHTQRVTKPEKHRRRLRAGILAGARQLWPHLFKEAAR